eukprot:CAMPEP_0202453190 /NCGR_PEP_ID=MMETSP1360-20130828/11213_1 /ASSEMBLY_ACC=CAM_ASM_000848 /TAXON_ID=515479 /ORGANISM="Licmophora paradoxa, Strain CCMP2313" /LENGTH=379 /DNA_ID=CAMNT_0049072213 /DNA_START=1 /DNA_END=1140 /DNA_ORIENTATION=+
MHIIIWLWGIMTASIAVGLDFIVMADLGGCHITRSIITYKSRCEIEPSFPECNDDRNAYNVGINVFTVFYVPPYAVSIFLIIVLMTMIYCKKWKCGNCLNQCECAEIDFSMDGSADFFAPISPAAKKLNPYADFLGEDSKCPEGDYEVPSNVASYNHPQTVPEYIPLTNLTDQVSGMTIEGGIKSPYSPSDIRSSENRRLSNTSLYLISSEVLDKKIPEEIMQSLGPMDGENQVPPDSGINPLENERPSHYGGGGDDGGGDDVPSRVEQSHHTQKEGPEDSKRKQITKRPSNNDGAMTNDMKETGFQYVLGFFLTYTITIINTANITEDLLLMEFLGILLLPSQGIWNFIFYTRGRMKTIRANNRKKTFRQVLWDAVFA